MGQNEPCIENAVSKRNYGIDLLRLISMLMVVTLHVFGKGGVLNSVNLLTIKGEFFWCIYTFCYCAVNVFAIISGYVGYTAKHKYTSLISLSLQLIFYSIIITIIDLVLTVSKGTPISPIAVVFNLLPTLKNYWYFSAYFCLFFFMPILNAIVANVSRKKLKITATFIFIVFCCWTQLYSNVSHLGVGYSVLWLAILYVVGAYFAKYKPLEKWSARKCIIAYLSLILFTIVVKIVIEFISTAIWGYPRFFTVLISYTSPTITLASIFLVCAFSKFNFKEGVNRIISKLAPLAFGVYIIHCHPIIYTAIGDSFAWVADMPILLGAFLALGISLGITAVCLFIDWLRLLLFRVCKIQKISSFVEKVFKNVSTFVFKKINISFEDEVGIE